MSLLSCNEIINKERLITSNSYNNITSNLGRPKNHFFFFSIIFKHNGLQKTFNPLGVVTGSAKCLIRFTLLTHYVYNNVAINHCELLTHLIIWMNNGTNGNFVFNDILQICLVPFFRHKNTLFQVITQSKYPKVFKSSSINYVLLRGDRRYRCWDFRRANPQVDIGL